MLSSRFAATCLIAALSLGFAPCVTIDKLNPDSSAWPVFRKKLGHYVVTYRLPPGGTPDQSVQDHVSLDPASKPGILAGVRFDRLRDGIFHATFFGIFPERVKPDVDLETQIVTEGWMKAKTEDLEHEFIDLGGVRWLRVSAYLLRDSNSKIWLFREAYFTPIATGYALTASLRMTDGVFRDADAKRVRRAVLREIVASIQVE